jgi:hypothetical protein
MGAPEALGVSQVIEHGPERSRVQQFLIGAHHDANDSYRLGWWRDTFDRP